MYPSLPAFKASNPGNLTPGLPYSPHPDPQGRPFMSELSRPSASPRAAPSRN